MTKQNSRFLLIGTLVLGLCIFEVTALSAAPQENEWKAPARSARKKNPVAVDDASIAAGKAVYNKECLSCHGPGGKGDGTAAKDLNPKPNDLTDPKVWTQTDGALFWKITEGKKPMPSYDKLLNEEQRWQVINYLHSAFAPKK